MTENYILLKLTNGQEVVGKFVEERSLGWLLDCPLCLNFERTAGNGRPPGIQVSLIPYIFALGPKPETPILVLRGAVAAWSHAVPRELSQAHFQQTSGLVMPNRG
jgi:hypothetical protein